MAHLRAFQSELVKQICAEAGLDMRMVRRIIIDLPCDGFATLYVEMYASDKTLEISWKEALDGAQVIKVE